MVNKSAEQTIIALDRFFDPITTSLLLQREMAAERPLDLDDARDLNQRFLPVLRQIPQIVTIIAADDSGRAYTLLRHETGLESRQSDAEAEPPRALWREWADATTLLRSWETDEDFDPRQRPWFHQTSETSADLTPHWTDPYTFFTSQRRGVTASIPATSNDADAPLTIVAFDVLIEDISRHTEQIKIGANGKTFIVSENGSLVGAPHGVVFKGIQSSHAATATPIDELDMPEVTQAFARWRSGMANEHDPFRYTVNNVDWWAAFHPYPLGGDDLWVASVLPQSELVARVGAQASLVPWVIGVIGVAAAVIAGLLARRNQYALDEITEKLRVQTDSEANRPALHVDDIKALIGEGESERLEFKSTVRWNIHSGKTGKEIELAWLKTVVAYLNTSGGHILIGVDDDGKIVGTEADQFSNEDKCLRHIDNLVSEHIGSEFFQYLTTRIHIVNEHRVISVHCQSASKPAFLKTGKDEEFYIRTGPASRKLPASQILDYVALRGNT